MTLANRVARAPDGHTYLAVIRPDKPEIPLAIAKEAAEQNDGLRIDNLPMEAETKGVSYTFAGWLCVDGEHVLDDDGQDIDKMQPGDSIISFKGRQS